jgi:peptidoglycan/xylan/chitin deacetylase (PgdA/CDA1 family)
VLGATISSTVSALIRWSGLATIIRHTIARNRVSILVYHDPTPETFEQHLRFLVSRYNLITLNELVDALGNEKWADLPPRALVVTFDDGHRGNADLLDLFQQYRVRPTIYLCSQIVGTKRHYWFLESKDPEPLKGLPNGERLALLERSGFSFNGDFAEAQALSVEEVRRLGEAVDFAAHTRFHPVLTMCSDAECADEIESAKPEIENLTGVDCADFSYPNGDYGEREMSLVRQAGYRSGRTIDLGWNGKHADPFRLRVLGTEDDASVNRLASDLTGITGFLARVRLGSLSGRHRPVAKTGENQSLK